MQYKKQDGAFENDKIIASDNVKIPKEITDLGLRCSDRDTTKDEL